MTKHLMLAAVGSLMSVAAFAPDGSAGGTSAVPTKEITVEGLKLTVKAPYRAGHTLNDNEASVLNQTFLENVRNNTASKIKAHKTAWEKEEANKGKTYPGLPENVAVEIQTYADGYEFGARTTRSTEPTDPVEREAYRIARDTVDEALSSRNIKKKDLPDGKYDDMVKLYAAKPDIQKEAKRRADSRAKLGADLLSDLGIDESATDDEGAGDDTAEA